MNSINESSDLLFKSWISNKSRLSISCSQTNCDFSLTGFLLPTSTAQALAFLISPGGKLSIRLSESSIVPGDPNGVTIFLTSAVFTIFEIETPTIG
jgi:hypothetical protein